MTTKEIFYAAVNVINSLPIDGPFQPSPDLLLKFYSYHKQATEGPCDLEKPYFWDSVGRKKWTAWRNLGNMSKEVAMKKYAEELIKIVETMSYSESVSNFMDLIGPFYETVFTDEAELKSCENQRTDSSSDEVKELNQQQEYLHSYLSKAVLKVDQVNNLADLNPNITMLEEVKEKKLRFAKNFSLQSCCNTDFVNPLFSKSSNLMLKDMKQTKINIQENEEHRRGTVNAISIAGCDTMHKKTRTDISHIPLKRILLLSVISLHQSLEKIIKHLDTLEFLLKKSKKEKKHTLPSYPPKAGLRSWFLVLIMVWPFVVQWLIIVWKKRK